MIASKVNTKVLSNVGSGRVLEVNYIRDVSGRVGREAIKGILSGLMDSMVIKSNSNASSNEFFKRLQSFHECSLVCKLELFADAHLLFSVFSTS